MAPEAFESNLLLGGMPAAIRAEFREVLSFVDLPARLMLERRDRPVEHAYFPTAGIARSCRARRAG
ncbi:hypothetical protein MBELCI_2397 [Limimaricola cinnabarinus LL-001]|uniref:Uncharacterized protein n=1 Tax=Limimaricola cinnabarinus LL-001 TaxID=1337093 RepID=U2Z4N9_9RHOB|nr:hypothetical protein MBELCI_2397 [Limimaricola cinnabarinus LL-001]